MLQCVAACCSVMQRVSDVPKTHSLSFHQYWSGLFWFLPAKRTVDTLLFFFQDMAGWFSDIADGLADTADWCSNVCSVMCWAHRNNTFCTFQDIADEIPLLNKSLWKKTSMLTTSLLPIRSWVPCVCVWMCVCVWERERESVCVYLMAAFSTNLSEITSMLTISLLLIRSCVPCVMWCVWERERVCACLVAAYQVMCALCVCADACVCERERVCLCTSLLPIRWCGVCLSHFGVPCVLM